MLTLFSKINKANQKNKEEQRQADTKDFEFHKYFRTLGGTERKGNLINHPPWILYFSKALFYCLCKCDELFQFKKNERNFIKMRTSSSSSKTDDDDKRNKGHHEETPEQVAASVRLHETQRQVDEVIGIMRSNVDKVLERDHKLSELDKIAAALEEGASDFETNTDHVKKKYGGRGRRLYCCKVMMCVLGILLLLLLFVLCDLFLTRWVFWVKCSETVGGVGLWCKVEQDNNNASSTTTLPPPPPATMAVEKEEPMTSPPPPPPPKKTEEEPPPPPQSSKSSAGSNGVLINKGHNVLDTGVLVEDEEGE